MDELEYQRNVKLVDFLLETKNKLITFCFLTVFSMLGVVLTEEKNHSKELSYYFIYIIPFFILIPISARIIYYRLWVAYINAEIHVKTKLYPNTSTIQTEQPTIDMPYICFYKLNYPFKIFYTLSKILQYSIDFIVNFEVFILSLCCFLLFLIKTWNSFESSNMWWWILYLVPVTGTVYIFFMCKSILNYDKIYKYHIKQWTWYMEATTHKPSLPQPQPEITGWKTFLPFRKQRDKASLPTQSENVHSQTNV